jgi:uncharacterized RDD family membrane protein YckC
MDPVVKAPPEPHRGYVSPGAKRAHLIAVIVITVGGFCAQTILPAAAWIVIMPTMMFGGAFREIDAAGAVAWDGSIWYRDTPLDPSGRGRSGLYRAGFEPGAKPDRIADLDGEQVRLLPGADRLWIVGSDTVGWFKDGAVSAKPSHESLGRLSRPFLLRGAPAVVERRPGAFRLLRLDTGRWRVERVFEDEGFRFSRLEIVACGDRLHAFVEHDGTIYHVSGLPPPDFEGWRDWATVTAARQEWVAIDLGGAPAVFAGGREPGARRVGVRLDGSEWTRILSDEPGFVTSWGVVELPGRRIGLLLCGFPGSLSLRVLDGDREVEKRALAAGFFGGAFVWIFVLAFAGQAVTPFLTAGVLALAMARLRVPTHAEGPRTVRYATLWRRGLAHGIDALIAGGPVIAGYALLFSTFFGDPAVSFDPSRMLGSMGLLIGGFAIALFCFFAFTLMEGLWGKTPGKWVLGIRVVGVDLQPCGVGHAFLRNLLRIVDSFFNYGVGLACAALTERWQRVGDIVARSIVVRD